MHRFCEVWELKMAKGFGTLPSRCDWHKPSDLGYDAAYLDAIKRMKRGEEQRLCLNCVLWYWDHEWGTPPPNLNMKVVRSSDILEA
jgi:hypothetical protein